MQPGLRPATPRSLILDLLSTLGDRAIPARALVAAGELLGIAENSLRVALARLLAARRVERAGRGAYRLGRAAQPIQAHVGGWRRIEERVVPWSGGWIGVHTAGLPRSERASLRRSDRALRFLGFRPCLNGLELRPDNLRPGVDGVRSLLRDLGLDARASVFGVRDLDPQSDARARELWNADALLRGYRASRAALERSLERLPRLANERAMAESFLLGGEVLRQLALDPTLPDAIVPTAERGALVATMRTYDRQGRAAWAEFMQRYGVSRARAPLEVRVAHAAGRLAPRPPMGAGA